MESKHAADMTYGLELLYEQSPVLESGQVIEALRRKMPIDLVSASDSIIAIGHPDQVGRFQEGNVPSITNIVKSNEEIDLDDYAPSVQQTWEWPGAEQALARCRYSVLMNDFTGLGVDHRDRLRRIAQVVATVAEVTSATVCHWRPAGCLVDPPTICEKFAFACNVRQFNADEQGSAVVMDTLGLTALGLVDAQCYFRELDPERVAPWLYGVAGAIFTRGDVIKDGDTVQGLEPVERWRCVHSSALVGPERTVIDIEPGRFSAHRAWSHN